MELLPATRQRLQAALDAVKDASETQQLDELVALAEADHIYKNKNRLACKVNLQGKIRFFGKSGKSKTGEIKMKIRIKTKGVCSHSNFPGGSY